MLDSVECDDFYHFRYDYLQFKDATGESFRFAHKVGLDGWPDVFIFAGPSLHFTFKSDSSNTEWGYKFKVRKSTASSFYHPSTSFC